MAKIFLIFFSIIQLSAVALSAESNLPLRGKGEFKWFVLDIYEATFWATPGDDFFSRDLKLGLKYKRDLKGKDIAEQSIKEMQRSELSENEAKIYRQKLLEIIPDVKEGDQIEARYSPEIGIIFTLNSNKELGRITDLTFSKKFLNIWLGENTSAPDLRRKLLGK